MVSFINQLNQEVLTDSKKLKRIFLQSVEHSNDKDFSSNMLKALELDILSFVREGQMHNQIQHAKFCNDLKNNGVNYSDVDEILNLWIEIISNIDGKTYTAVAETTNTEKASSEEEISKFFISDTEDDMDVFKEISYVNPVLPDIKNRIFIPCGFGSTDQGFFIYGIKKSLLCTHPYANIYALVYNLLVRNTQMNDEDIPEFLISPDTKFAINYRSIYRLAVIILQLIRHNIIKGTEVPLTTVSMQDLKSAVNIINSYVALFSKLSDIHVPNLVISDKNTIQVTLSGKTGKGIYIENNTECLSPARELWFGVKINYSLDETKLHIAEKLLRIISPYNKFKEGQYDALCSMINSKKHCVCIMPTGSGKSLIYYMASILQPLPIFVVAPTDILIEDQIRNLKSIHRIDNVSHMQLGSENSFKNYNDITNSLNYLTPTTLQSRNLLVKFKYINNGTKLFGAREIKIAEGSLASYIVLDEIHCLSNWGHDFRPEYLMLSQYLHKSLSCVNFWGFTATANYTVVEDVQKQLNIPQENFFSPLAFEKYNISYYFHQATNTDEMYKQLKVISDSIIARNERTLVFTKDDETSRKVAEKIGYEADVFTHDHPQAYHHFVDGKCLILVANEDLGIGVNFPNIKNIIHFGLPLSKNEYVQEVGRAGRANERVKSYMIFLENAPQNVPPALLKRDTDINQIPFLLKGLDNDFASIYKKLTNDCPTKEVLYDQLLALYKRFNYFDRPTFMETFDFKSSQKARQQLFMLYTIGYIRDWYAYDYNRKMDSFDMLIDICSSNTMAYRSNPQMMFNRMINRMVDYFDVLGNNREAIAKTNRASSIEELIYVYVEWYYNKYLYHHNEQFLDLYSFILNNLNGDRNKITQEIKDYFVLPFVKLKTDEAYYRSLTIEEIIEKAITGVGADTVANLERINTNRYSINIDTMLLLSHYRVKNLFAEDRFFRIWNSQDSTGRNLIKDALVKLYGTGNLSAKLELLNFIESQETLLNIKLNKFLSSVYADGEKDLIYFGLMANQINKHFKHHRRKNNV